MMIWIISIILLILMNTNILGCLKGCFKKETFTQKKTRSIKKNYTEAYQNNSGLHRKSAPAMWEGIQGIDSMESISSTPLPLFPDTNDKLKPAWEDTGKPSGAPDVVIKSTPIVQEEELVAEDIIAAVESKMANDIIALGGDPDTTFVPEETTESPLDSFLHKQ